MSNLATIDNDTGNAVTPTVVTPMTMIDRALATNASPDTLERLLALQERWEKSQARKAFDEAVSAAKSEIQPIEQNRRVAFESKKAGAADTNYRFEDLAQIERQVGPVLTKYGLSYRYRAESEIDHPVRVTCILAHRDGHSEETTLAAGRDSSGNKNSIQAIGSTITYLQRYTLKAALGLAVAHDDDGRSSTQTVDDGTISQQQAETLRKLIDEVGGGADIFCNYFKIESIPDLPASEFDRAVKAIEKKRGAK